MQRKFLLASIVAACVLGVGTYLWKAESPAPVSTFVLLDGSQKHSTDFIDKVTLVNFWATSCTTCVAEMPQIVTTFNQYHAKGFRTIAVAMQYDPPAYVLNFAQSRKLPFDVAIDNTGALARAWGDVQLTPTSYLVDQKGQIVKRYVGQPDFAELHGLIEKLLSAS